GPMPRAPRCDISSQPAAALQIQGTLRFDSAIERLRNTRSLRPTSALCPFAPTPGANGSPNARARFTGVGMTRHLRGCSLWLQSSSFSPGSPLVQDDGLLRRDYRAARLLAGAAFGCNLVPSLPAAPLVQDDGLSAAIIARRGFFSWVSVSLRSGARLPAGGRPALRRRWREVQCRSIPPRLHTEDERILPAGFAPAWPAAREALRSRRLGAHHCGGCWRTCSRRACARRTWAHREKASPWSQ